MKDKKKVLKSSFLKVIFISVFIFAVFVSAEFFGNLAYSSTQPLNILKIEGIIAEIFTQ